MPKTDKKQILLLMAGREMLNTAGYAALEIANLLNRYFISDRDSMSQFEQDALALKGVEVGDYIYYEFSRGVKKKYRVISIQQFRVIANRPLRGGGASTILIGPRNFAGLAGPNDPDVTWPLKRVADDIQVGDRVVIYRHPKGHPNFDPNDKLSVQVVPSAKSNNSVFGGQVLNSGIPGDFLLFHTSQFCHFSEDNWSYTDDNAD